MITGNDENNSVKASIRKEILNSKIPYFHFSCNSKIILYAEIVSQNK